MNNADLLADMTVRVAGADDLPAVVALLPGGVARPAHTTYLVAERVADGSLLGAAFLHTGGRRALFRVAAAEVVPAEAVGVLLLRACIVQARRSGARALAPDAMLREGDPAEAVLQKHGFRVAQELVEYVMDGESGWQVCDRVCRLLERRGKIPDDARVLALADAPVVPVQALIRRHLGGTLAQVAPRVRGDLSTVVQLGPRVVAAVIVTEENGQLVCPYDLVDAGFRHSWVTPTLWGRAFRAGLDAGYTDVRFRTNEEQFRSFSNFAKRMQSERVGCERRYLLKL